MAKKERLPPTFSFPQGIDETFLGKMVERVGQGLFTRTAVAHQIEEEGLFLRDMVAKFLPGDKEAKIAVDEYTRVGTIILETESAWQSGDNSHPVELLKNDPRGFSLLTWWVNFRLEGLKHSLASKEERQGAIVGMTKGNKRFRKLYQALV